MAHVVVEHNAVHQVAMFSLLTLPTPEVGGFSGYACGNPLRWRLTGPPGPTAWGA